MAKQISCSSRFQKSQADECHLCFVHFTILETTINSMDKKQNERIGLVFLHDAGSSGPDISSFFSSVPLESFGDKSFQEVTEMLNIDIITPTAQVRSDTDDDVESSLFWEWFAVSPDWRMLGLQNTQKEDRASMNVNTTQ